MSVLRGGLERPALVNPSGRSGTDRGVGCQTLSLCPNRPRPNNAWPWLTAMLSYLGPLSFARGIFRTYALFSLLDLCALGVPTLADSANFVGSITS